MERVTRVGVYGVVGEQGKILLIRQMKGPYKGKFDFPGGGMEFGETPEQTLRRELKEEVAVEFDSLSLMDNISSQMIVPATSTLAAYLFFHVGMIYRVKGFRLIATAPELESTWIDPQLLLEQECSLLLWKYIRSSR